MKKGVLILILFGVFNCKKEKGALKYPVIVPSEFNKIVSLNKPKMVAANNSVFGINIIDTLKIQSKAYYDTEYFTDEYSPEYNSLETDSLIVYVDYTQKNFHTGELSGYNSFSPPPPPPPARKEDSIFVNYNHEEAIKDYNNFVMKHCKSYPLYIYNSSSKSRIIQRPLSSGDLFFLLEAKNQKGTWKPIEYWNWQKSCGTGHQDYRLKPKHFMISSVRRYKGDFKTKMRVKLKSFDKTFYSNEFYGEINFNQFNSDSIISKTSKLSNYRGQEHVLNKLRLLFLD